MQKLTNFVSKVAMATTIVAAVAISASPKAMAATAELASIGTSGGTQTLNGTYGMKFQTGDAISVSALGVFDFQGDGLAVSHQVGLWDSAGTLLASDLVGSGTAGTLIGGFRYKDLGSSVSLAANSTYYVGAVFTPFTDLVGTGLSVSMNFGSTFLATTYLGPGLTFPAPEFQFENFAVANLLGTTAVPLPAALTLLLGALGGLGLVARRRRTA